MLIYKIHPAIGVARVGDSPDAFFVGPEAPGSVGVEIGPGGAETPITKHKAVGKIKRQGARFRVFEYDKDAAGTLTLKREITADDAQIVWKVDLVNRKAAFNRTIDPGIDPEVAPQPRNTDLTGAARDGLIIRDPRNRTVSGKNQPGVPFDQGTFLGAPVFLGELRTDGAGRLIVLGGRGASASVPPGKPIVSFANNNRWHDDVADGPVTATITFPGQPARPADAPAWVTVTPPDYAPGIGGVVTLYDVATQAAIDAGFLKPDSQPSFSRHILPLILRAATLRFVNQFSLWDSVPRNPADLAQTGAAAAPLRQKVFDMLISNIAADLDNAIIPDFLATYFDQYRQGNFVSDLGAAPPATTAADDLDRAALEACVGLNFFPGIEASLNLRHPAIYSEARRIDHGAAEVFPGFLTEIMAVPWQADFLKCQGQWWPSQRPDFVMTDPANIPGSKTTWAQGIVTHQDMIDKFGTLPFVAPATVGGQTVFAQEAT
jgi:hypothetical protein